MPNPPYTIPGMCLEYFLKRIQSFFITSRLGLWELGHLLFHSQLGRRAGPLPCLGYSPKNFYVKSQLRRFCCHATFPRHLQTQSRAASKLEIEKFLIVDFSMKMWRKLSPDWCQSFEKPPGLFWHRSGSIWYQIFSQKLKKWLGGRNWNRDFD